MFGLHSISITNFKSYRGTQKFKFPVADGLYFFTGQNLVTPALGTNGCGKSSLLDAVTWCLYGRTTRGLKANDVIPWGSTAGCQVLLELTVGNARFRVKRTQKPNNLLLNDKPVDQEELEKTIRLNFDGFRYSVLNAQFGTSFFELAPSAKLTLFSDIMGLDYWLKKSDEAAQQAKVYEGEIEGLQTLIDRQGGQLATVAEDIRVLQAAEAAFETEKAAKVDEIKQHSVTTYKEVQKLKSQNVKRRVDKAELMVQLKDVNAKAKGLEERRDGFVDEISKLAITHSTLANKASLLRSQLAKIQELGHTCPTCRQKVDGRHVDNETGDLNSAIRDVTGRLEKADDLLRNLTAGLIKVKTAFSGQTALAEELRDDISQLDTKITLAEAKVEGVDARLDQLGERLLEIQKAQNPHSVMLATKRAKQKELKASVATNTDAKHAAEAAHTAVSFWVKGFKRVRLFIIEQAFRTLEIEVNNSLTQLGMVDWQITFDVERENKSGGITKGFVVFIKGPANKEPVRWESWSGGETQRLQLAGDLGLANLIMQQAGLTNTIEFFDEPSTHLSTEGMLDLANMLYDRAVNEGKRIWIVDHTSITNFGDFNAVILARKDKNGTTISYEGS